MANVKQLQLIQLPRRQVLVWSQQHQQQLNCTPRVLILPLLLQQQQTTSRQHLLPLQRRYLVLRPLQRQPVHRCPVTIYLMPQQQHHLHAILQYLIQPQLPLAKEEDVRLPRIPAL